MSLLAVSAGMVLLSGAQRLQKVDEQVWKSAQRSVAMILKNGIPCGDAALIDKSGLFIANQSAVSAPSMQARLSNGKVVTLDWRSTDVPTQTVLLQAEDWNAEDGTVVTLPQSEIRLGHVSISVLVVLPSGPIPGELWPGSRIGVMSSSKRAYKLSEVRFEASAQEIAGALVFDHAGNLVGLLNATLAEDASDAGTRRVKVPLQHTGGGSVQKALAAPPTFGPADQTVGYTVGPEVLRRVVSGFLSLDHKVKHPAIGINCQNAQTTGALIIAVKKDSPAEAAGLLPGDVIVKMDETLIKNQIDFAMFMQTKDPGDAITVVVTRDLVPHTFKIVVGTIQRALSSSSLSG